MNPMIARPNISIKPKREPLAIALLNLFLYNTSMNIEELKKQNFRSTKDEVLTSIFKALSDPTRLAMVRYLALQVNEVNISAINEAIGVTGSLSHYHGSFFHNPDLFLSRKDGREKFIRINRDLFEEYLPGFLDQISK